MKCLQIHSESATDHSTCVDQTLKQNDHLYKESVYFQISTTQSHYSNVSQGQFYNNKNV